MRNLDDMILIAVEMFNELKLFDTTVLNPINFSMISILELA
jgi:hypothetical protein